METTRFVVKKVQNGNSTNLGTFIYLDKCIDAISKDAYKNDRENWEKLAWEELIIDFVEQLKEDNKIEMKFDEVTYMIEVED